MSISSVSLPSSAACIDPASENAIAHIRQRMINLMLLRDEDVIKKNDQSVIKTLESQIADPADELFGGWSDPVAKSSPYYAGGGVMAYHMLALARAWSTPSSRFYRSDKLLESFCTGLAVIKKYIYRSCPFPGNWWNWQIGTPECMSEILLIAPQLLPENEIETYIDTLDYLMAQVQENHPGANAMWTANGFLRLGVIQKKIATIEKATRMINRATAITDHQGILKDYSYSFHGRGINLGYGSLHFEYLGQLTYILGDCPWRMSDETLHNAVQYLLEFIRWTLVGDSMDVFIVDRGISHSEANHRQLPTSILSGALLLTTGPIPRRDEVLSCCQWMIDSGIKTTNAIAVEIAAAMKNVKAVAPAGVKFWPEAEYFVSRLENGGSIAIKMCSEKNKLYFGINRTNLKGWHISDGHMIIRNSQDAFRNNVLATMDWERLTGITRGEHYKLPAETHGQSWYVNGLTTPDGKFGVCGQRFSVVNLDRTFLEVNKAWFFLGDAIVALGARVVADNNDPIETIIRHVMLPDDIAAKAVLGDVELEVEILEGHDCAYILPQKPKILVRTEKRSGAWTQLRHENPEADQNVHTRTFWTALINHGVKPKDEKYVIIYLPGMNAKQAAQWWAKNPIEILDNRSSVQIVRDNRTGNVFTFMEWYGVWIEKK